MWREIDALRHQTVGQLRVKYLEVFRQESRSNNQKFLVRRIAWRMQADGMKIAVIERKLFGGTCVNTGCTPTKTLVASAYAIHLARSFCNDLQVDMKRLKERKDAVVARSGIEKWMSGLPTVLREFPKLAEQCAKESTTFEQFLLRLVEQEMLDRERRAIERRIRAAKFPVSKSLETYDFLATPSLNKKLVVESARGEGIGRRENVLALGNSGTGKTHIGLALGLAACQ
jgi:hypothetical protein